MQQPVEKSIVTSLIVTSSNDFADFRSFGKVKKHLSCCS